MRTGTNIYKRKDGRWEARYHKGRTGEGKLIYGFCYGKTYSEAKARMEQAKQHWQEPPPEDSEKPPLISQLCQEWMNCNRLKLKDSTTVKYRLIIDKHINPFFRGCFLTQVSSEMISNFSADLMEEKKLSPKTTKDILVLLHSILRYGHREYPVKAHSVEITYPRYTPREMRVLNRNEQKKLTDFLLCDLNPCKFGVLLALWTGIRIGELCALRWEQISLADHTVKIEKTMMRLQTLDPNQPQKTKVVTHDPKTTTALRTIPLCTQLGELCRRMNPGNKNAYILTGTEEYMEPRVLQYRFRQYMQDCGIYGVTFHTLRHSFATRCVEANFEIKSLSEILGHANTAITMNRYVHSSVELKRENLRKLEIFQTQSQSG